MQLLFADESGSPPPTPKPNQKYFVIGGVIIPEHHWHGIARKFAALKAKFKRSGEVKWRYFSPHNDDEQNPILHLSGKERDDVRNQIFGLITERKSVKLITSVASIEAAFERGYVHDADSLYQMTYKTLTERFQYYLQDLTRTVGRKENGIVVLDNKGIQHDTRMRELHQKLLSSGKETISNYEHLIEGLFIAPSHMSVGIQLADLVAGAVWRYFERKDDRWWKHIVTSFRTSRSGKLDGYGVIKFPKIGWR
jgi:hypothetical protein